MPGRPIWRPGLANYGFIGTFYFAVGPSEKQVTGDIAQNRGQGDLGQGHAGRQGDQEESDAGSLGKVHAGNEHLSGEDRGSRRIQLWWNHCMSLRPKCVIQPLLVYARVTWIVHPRGFAGLTVALATALLA